MANNLAVTGNLTVGGTLVVTGTTNLGAAADTVLVTNFNADKMDGADLSTDGTLAANSDVLVPSQKAVKTYADLRALDNAVVKLTGDQTIAGAKTFSGSIIDKNGKELVQMTFASQHFDETVSTGTSAGDWTRSKVFTFGGNVQALTFLEVHVNFMVDGAIFSDSLGNWHVDAATISGTDVTVTVKGRASTVAHDMSWSVDIGAVY